MEELIKEELGTDNHYNETRIQENLFKRIFLDWKR